jgi:ATP/maltotriose-dependent transcriptional regulator MalT
VHPLRPQRADLGEQRANRVSTRRSFQLQAETDQEQRSRFAHPASAPGDSLVAEGMKNRDIAEALHVTEHTVSNYTAPEG